MAAHAKMRYMLRDNVSQAAEKETTEQRDVPERAGAR